MSKVGLFGQVNGLCWRRTCECGTWWLFGQWEKTCWCSGFFDGVKRWFKSITERCITEVSSSRTLLGCTGKPLVLPGGTAQWISPAHLTHLRHGEVVPIPSFCCDRGELDGGTERCPEGWNTPSTGIKPAWYSPMSAAGDSTSSRLATTSPSPGHRELAGVVSAPWFNPFIIYPWYAHSTNI